MRVGAETFTLYRVKFSTYNGTSYFLHTFDEAKIGPWLAEMFGMFPYRVSMPTSVEIEPREGYTRS